MTTGEIENIIFTKNNDFVVLINGDNDSYIMSLKHNADSDRKTITDVIKTLNTELSAGKGPDILILDGLLEDLGDILSIKIATLRMYIMRIVQTAKFIHSHYI